MDGFFLNSKLTSFSHLHHSPNRPQPGKRPITFTAPTIFTRDHHPVLGIGSSGGCRITFILAEVIIRHLFHRQALQQAISHPRFYVKDRVVYTENELPQSVGDGLRNRGYRVQIKPAGVFYGGVQAIGVDPKTGKLDGGYDFRRGGVFCGGH